MNCSKFYLLVFHNPYNRQKEGSRQFFFRKHDSISDISCEETTFPISIHSATTRLTPQLVGTSTITYNLSPYIGSQTFLWSLVQVSSKLSSFPCTLSAKCTFLGLLRESVRRVFGTPTLLQKYSFTGLLPTSVLESFWRSISTHLTWISCGDWIDRRRHSKTFLFAINQLVFATWNSSRAVQRLHEFFFQPNL